MVIGQLLLLAKRNDQKPCELNLSVFKWLETGWLVSKRTNEDWHLLQGFSREYEPSI